MTLYYFKDPMGVWRHAEQEGENRLPAAKQDHRDKVDVGRDDGDGDDGDGDGDGDDDDASMVMIPTFFL